MFAIAFSMYSKRNDKISLLLYSSSGLAVETTFDADEREQPRSMQYNAKLFFATVMM